jgi:hypothetical protein
MWDYLLLEREIDVELIGLLDMIVIGIIVDYLAQA